jgi:Spy/CpxP family protein refolding chaperone
VKALVLALALAAATALAQHAHHSPYAGLEQREVKALSEQQVADLHSGRGMGLAMAAELNGYPGPMHVLELGDQLGLSAEQRQRTEALFAQMRREAVALGDEIVARETALDRAFASRSARPHEIEALVGAIGERQAALRYTHLKYHLSMLEVLDPEQVALYGRLRGYHKSP